MAAPLFYLCWGLAVFSVYHKQEQRGEESQAKNEEWSLVTVALKTSPKKASHPICTHWKASGICLKTLPTWETGRWDLHQTPFLCCCGPRRSWGQEVRKVPPRGRDGLARGLSLWQEPVLLVCAEGFLRPPLNTGAVVTLLLTSLGSSGSLSYLMFSGQKDTPLIYAVKSIVKLCC